MRCAVIVALGDPRSSDAGTWLDAVTWLRQELTEFVFRVSVIEGENVEQDLAAALVDVTPEDDVVLHVSGRLVDRGVVRTAGGRRIRLQTLGDTLAARPAANVSLFTELVYEGPDDALVGAEQVASIISDFRARSRGYAMLAAVRTTSAPIEGLALTRYFLGVARALVPHGMLLSSAVYQRIAGSPESLACAQSFAFVRGRFERELASSLPSVPPAPQPTEHGSLDERIAEAQKAGDWPRVVELRRKRLDTLESPQSRVREFVAIARILQVNIYDSQGALEALEQAHTMDPMGVGVLQALRRGYERLGRWEDAFAAIGALADLSPSPTDRAELRLSQALLALDTLHDRERALELLQAALESDPAHERALAAYRKICGAGSLPRDVEAPRSMAPIRARGTLDAAAWALLRAPGSDAGLESLFTQIGPAAIETRLEQLALRKRLVALDPAARLDETSTAPVVQSFRWAACVLGVPCPALYTVDVVPGEIAAVRTPKPSTAVGPSMLRGRSAKELAYLAGRHLTYYRAEHQVLIYFPTSPDLTDLLMATIDLATPRGRRVPRNASVAALRDSLERCMTPTERALVAAAVGDLDQNADLDTWSRSVELTAGRAGLFLCGDLATATGIIRSESRAIAGVFPDERRDDVVAFCSSPEHAELRRRFAVTTPVSPDEPPIAADTLHSP